MAVVHLNHMLTFTQPGNYQMAAISPDQARSIVSTHRYVSHVGFPNTRELMEEVLDINIGMPRLKSDRLTILNPGDKVLLFLPKQGYRPEPKTRLRMQDFEIMLVTFELMGQTEMREFMDQIIRE